MQIMSIALAASETKPFDMAGSYFEIIDSAGAIDVAFYDANGARTRDGELLNALSGFYVNGAFSRFEVKDRTGAAQTVQVAFGSNTGGSRRSPGIVSVVDGGKERTKSNLAFTLATNLGATAGQYNFISLNNPAGSGRRAVIDQAMVNGVVGTTDFITGFMAAGQLAGSALVGNAPSKLSGGASSVMEIRTLTQVGSISGSALFVSPANTPNPVVWRPPEPIIVLPGNNFFLRYAVNTSAIATIDFYEEVI